ncbi:FxsA family protein [candidate division KSB1 bacterium]
MGYLVTLFIVLPLAELYLLIEIGKVIGSIEVIGLIIVTGIVGAWLARSQGLYIISSIRTELAQGRMPAARLVDGVMVLAGGLLLLTPGLLTDAFGFTLLLPFTRDRYRHHLRRWFEKRVEYHLQGNRPGPS